MLLNYLKLSIRLLARNPFFTAINIGGLSLGFAVFFILWPYTQSELKSDQFIPDFDNIERPIRDFRWTDNGGETWGHIFLSTAPSFATVLLANEPGIIEATRYLPQQWFDFEWTPNLKPDLIVAREKNGQVIYVNRIEKATCADKNFFRFFGFPMVHGLWENVLKDANGVVISASRATALFGDVNPIGEPLKVNGQEFVVSGVFKNIPGNSHLDFEYVFSSEGRLSVWDAPPDDLASIHQYYKLVDGGERLASILNRNKEKLVGAFLRNHPNHRVNFDSQPLAEVAYSQGYTDDYFAPKSKFMLNALAAISLVVLIMAWLNYINLTVSKTRTRFKEVAARKVSGAIMRDLISQFICQSTVVNVLAALVGITLVQIVRVPFDLFFGIQVTSMFQMDWQILAFFAAIFILGIVGSSVYPALLMMQHTTRQLLSQRVPTGKRFANTLFTTLQYTAALVLVVWIFVMNDQLNFILNKELGLDKENVVVVKAPVIGLEVDGLQKMTQFANQMKSELGDDKVTLSKRVVGEFAPNMRLRRVGSDAIIGNRSHGGVDENYIPLYGLKIIAGRNFLSNEQDQSIILSRMTSERLGFASPEDAVGSKIELQVGESWHALGIVGVIEDYRSTSFLMQEGNTESVTGNGQFFTYLNSVTSEYVPQRISIKISGSESLKQITEVERLYSQQFPGNLFDWTFLDEQINRQYGDYRISRNQLTLFTILAIVIACLGLLGMISNKVAERLKEISVRRILGARHWHVVSLLLQSTGMQLGLALLIGLPIAWRFSGEYLEKFTHRIDMQWWHFAFPVLILAVIMFSTIASVLLKAARNNPVEALKYE